MLPFDTYPDQGRRLLGRPGSGNGPSRTGYGLALQRMTRQSCCAYCGVDLVADYYRWLLLTVDHVVPRGEAIRLGMPATLYEDAINLVLACSGCNGYLNLYRCDAEPATEWSVEQFTALRDAVFSDRHQRIAVRREAELALFASQPWVASGPIQADVPPPPVGAAGPSSAPIDGLVIFTDNDAGYLAWLDAHPAGFVVNTLRTPSAGNLILHRATCHTISGTPTRGDRLTGEWIKACSLELAALDDWAKREVGGELRACGICRPLG